MKPWDSRIWQDIADVKVTDEEINTAIRVISFENAFENKTVLFQTVMLSATVIAYLRALKDRGADRGLLARMVCDELPFETKRLLIEVHGLIDPFDAAYEQQERKRAARGLRRDCRARA
ncbi:hypothetical protein [Aureimonas populi]|uniref:Uncharacterized protein n=1 Tax=Aureimonas populi TaxID=1701758 RepID=A0ABW5CLN0_9HYPH|nr:hypothetical protein [Aureimonas populi]